MRLDTHISVRDLCVWYNEEQALNHVTIDIPDRKITAIIGPSGCGKTTFLKALNRLIELHDGTRVTGQVFVDGEDIYDPAVEVTHLRKKVGILLQRPQVLPMSIYDNVAFGPRIHGIRKRNRLDELVKRHLEEAGLWSEVQGRLHDPASRLSIGQQQRLCLARALAVEPNVILGDEPTSALDPISAQRIEEHLIELGKRHTIVLVTHSLEQARRLADHVIFLYLGDLVEQGPAENLFEHPKYLKTRCYLSGRFVECPHVDQVLDLKGRPSTFDQLATTGDSLRALETGQVLKIVVDHYSSDNGVAKALEAKGHRIIEVKRLNQSDWEILIQKESSGAAYEI
jgi:phosphate transport system ATP-binding protein